MWEEDESVQVKTLKETISAWSTTNDFFLSEWLINYYIHENILDVIFKFKNVEDMITVI